MTETEVKPEHFEGCHPEHENAPTDPQRTWQELIDTTVEGCWHCGATTTRGCRCIDCFDNQDYVPTHAVFHCPTCRRWWAYMQPQITTLDFGGAR